MQSIVQQVKDFIQLDVSDQLLIALVFEMSRFADKDFTAEIQKLQKNHNVVIDTPTRKLLRKKYYYGDFCLLSTPFEIALCKYGKDKVKAAFEDFYRYRWQSLYTVM